MPKAFLIRKSISAKELYLSFQWRPVSPPPSPEDDDDKDQPLNLTTGPHQSHAPSSTTTAALPLVPQRVPVIQSASKAHLPLADLSYPSSSSWLTRPPVAPILFSPPKPQQTLIPVQQPLCLQIDSQSNHSFDSSSSSSSLSDGRTGATKSGQTSPAAVPPPSVQILASRLGKLLPVAVIPLFSPGQNLFSRLPPQP